MNAMTKRVTVVRTMMLSLTDSRELASTSELIAGSDAVTTI